MTTGTAAIVRLASAMLPADAQGRFADEWNAELIEVHQRAGRRAATSFAVALLPAAVQMTINMRRDSSSGYAEMSLAALLGLVPVVFLFVLGVSYGTWTLALAQVINVAGILLVAYGFWKHDGRLLDSLLSLIHI